jgi:ribosomal protein S20
MDIKKENEVWKFLNSLTTTENGEVAFNSTGDKNLDLFSTINRDVQVKTLVKKFVEAWNENPEYAIKVLLNFRDVREGKGEKNISKIMILIIKIVHPDIYEKIIPLFVEVGCWKDLLFLYEMGIHYGIDSQLEISAFVKQLINDQNIDRPSLCAKWAPTEGCHFDRKTKVAKKLMRELKMKPKEYRKMLTSLRTKIKLVETQLSQQHTSEINFSTVPSKAHVLYKKAFLRGVNAEGETRQNRIDLSERYKKYLEDLSQGKEKANFKGIMPHELVNELLKTHGQNPELIESQWNSIRSEIENISVFDRCISIVDVSGSMESGDSGASTPRPIDIAIALGILVSECSKGPFKHKIFTFHEQPILADLISFTILYEKIKYVKDLPWGGNTNIEAVFQKILDTGVLMSLPQDQMPDRLFIFTDMQFDQVSGNRLKTFDKIKEKFAKHGYKMPQIICWNLRSIENIVFTKDDADVCMLSGFSTPILKAFMTCKEISPLIVFLAAINHYKVPEVILKPIDESKINLEKLEIAIKKCDFKYIEEKPEKSESSLDDETVIAVSEFRNEIINMLQTSLSGVSLQNIVVKDLSSVERVKLARQLLEMDDSDTIDILSQIQEKRSVSSNGYSHA